MFQKGPQPGATPKANALRLPELESAYCRRKRSHGIAGYVVYAEDGTAIAAAGNAQEAWSKAEAKILNRRKP